MKTFADALMSADADTVFGAGYGERSPERVNCRNGCRVPEWDTRAGTVELAILKLRSASCFPTGWCSTVAASSGPSSVWWRHRICSGC